MEKKKIYISGPMRGIEQHNRPAFTAAREMLDALDFEPVDPSLFSITSSVIYLNDEDWLQIDRLILKHCDAIFMLPGWQESEGASLEWADAVELGLPVYGFDLEA